MQPPRQGDPYITSNPRADGWWIITWPNGRTTDIGGPFKQAAGVWSTWINSHVANYKEQR